MQGFFFLFGTAFRPAVGPTQPPTQWVLGFFSPGVKRPGHEAHHSLPSTAEVKNAWSYTSTACTSSWRDASLNIFMTYSVKHRDNSTFVFHALNIPNVVKVKSIRQLKYLFRYSGNRLKFSIPKPHYL
jgi:hypothetical protein